MSYINKDVLVVQPFKMWEGHYSKYVNSFYEVGACEVSHDTVPILLKLLTFKSKPKNFFIFYLARFLNVFFYNLYATYKLDKNSRLLLLEFEPIAFFIVRIILGKNKVYQTVHSINRKRYSSFIKEGFSLLQRLIFKVTLRLVSFFDLYSSSTTFIVHSVHHQTQLKMLVGNSEVVVIDYPCPKPKSDCSYRHDLKGDTVSILIFGVVREDKGIYEFLEAYNSIGISPNYIFRVVGKIEDKRIKENNYPGIEFINSYIPDSAVDSIFHDSDILLLPYGDSYTGGAGPMKDAASYALPVLCSNIAIFREVLEENNFGLLIEDFYNLHFYIDKLVSKYQKFSKNALVYSTNNNWSTLAKNYIKIIKSN